MLDNSVVTAAMRSPAIVSAAALLFVAYIIRWLMTSRKRLNLPVADKPDDGDWTMALMKARAKYPDVPFILPMPQPIVILPNNLVDDVKNLPESLASFNAFIYERMAGRYTGIGEKPHPELADAIRVELTRNIGKILNDLQDEVNYAFDQEIGSAPTWTPFPVYFKLLQIIALLSGRTFVGLPLCRDKEWRDATINFTVDSMTGINAILAYKPFFRPFVAPFVPELRRVGDYRTFAARKLEPYFAPLVAEFKANGKVSEDTEDGESLNLVHWVLRHFEGTNKKVDVADLGEEQMFAAFAAIHTTSMNTSYALYDLAANPEYAAELREELERVLDEEGFEDRRLRKTSMPKLKKLDSFLKESQRVCPPSMLPMQRKVIGSSGVTLSTGLHLPQGTVFSFSHAFQPNSPFPNTNLPAKSLNDPSSQPPLEVFYPWRYLDIRSHPGEESRHQLVSTGPESLPFGHGQHACPGRFFASNEIKVILTEMLKRYDIGLGPNGEGESETRKKPAMSQHGTNYGPDVRGVIFLRDRKV